MFKAKLEDFGLLQQMNKSSLRETRATLLKDYNNMDELLDILLNKKSNIQTISLKSVFKVQLVLVDGEIILFEQQYKQNNLVVPVLQVLLKYPQIMPRMQVDKGAISRVIMGANIMCPGLTSQGGYIHQGVNKHTIVAIYAQGKQYPFAIGKMQMSSQEIVEKNEGIAIEMLHYLKDGLWNYKEKNKK